MDQSEEEKKETGPETPEKKTPAPPGGSYFGSVLEDQSEKYQRHIRFAQVALIIVAVLTLYATIGSWWRLSGVAHLLSDEVEAKAQFVLTVSTVVGVIFLGLFYWANKKPFAACLIAFFLYTIDITIALIFKTESGPKLNIIRIIIILALLKGIHSGWLYSRAEKEKAE